MKSWWKWLLAAVLVAVVAGGVAKFLQLREQRAAASAATAPEPALELSDADVTQVQRLEFSRTVPVSGGLKAVHSAFVKAKVAGELQTLAVREGDLVRAGQVIGQIDPTEFDWRVRQAEQTASAAKAQLDIARRNLENARGLVAQGFISSTALETTAANEATAHGNWQAAVAAVELARKARRDATLVAPLSGVVAQRLAQPGERLALDARVVEIVDLSRFEVEAAVPAEDVASIAIGHPARLQVDGLPEAVGASVARINPSTQAGTRAVMVYLAVEGSAGLRQGLFARGAILLPARTAIAVAASAIRNDQARPYLLAIEGGRITTRPVRTGASGEVAAPQGEREPVVELVDAPGAPAPGEGLPVLRGSAGAVRDGTVVRWPQGETAARAAPAPAAEPTAAPAASR